MGLLGIDVGGQLAWLPPRNENFGGRLWFLNGYGWWEFTWTVVLAREVGRRKLLFGVEGHREDRKDIVGLLHSQLYTAIY